MSDSAADRAIRTRSQPAVVERYRDEILATPDFFDVVTSISPDDVRNSVNPQQLNGWKASYDRRQGKSAAWKGKQKQKLRVSADPVSPPDEERQQPSLASGFRFQGAEFDPARPATLPQQPRTPPEVDWEAVARGTAAHFETLVLLSNMLANRLGRGCRTWEPSDAEPSFDLGWWNQEQPWVAEVKSLPKSRAGQRAKLRLGLGQLLEALHELRQTEKKVRGALVVERRPIEADKWYALCDDLGVVLAWPPDFDAMT